MMKRAAAALLVTSNNYEEFMDDCKQQAWRALGDRATMQDCQALDRYRGKFDFVEAYPDEDSIEYFCSMRHRLKSIKQWSFAGIENAEAEVEVPEECRSVFILMNRWTKTSPVPKLTLAQARHALSLFKTVNLRAGLFAREFDFTPGAKAIKLRIATVGDMKNRESELLLMKKGLGNLFDLLFRALDHDRPENQQWLASLYAGIRKIQINAPSYLTAFDFDRWITGGEDDAADLRIFAPQPSPELQEFDEKVTACKKQSHTTCRVELGITELDSGSTVDLLLSSGDNGKLYGSSQEPDIVIKVPGNRILYCRELVVMQALQGLTNVPALRSFDWCGSSALIMDKVGDREWPSQASIAEAHLITGRRIARIIEIVKSLHERGYMHGDIHERNVRISLDSEDSVFLLDFDTGRPLSQSYSRFVNPHVDMAGLALNLVPVIVHSRAAEFRAEMHQLLDSEAPRYDYWIDIFRNTL